MKIKKQKGTFNDYSVELSWGQLNAVYQALEQDHSDPLADELFAELGWYLQNVPGPGEDEDEYKEAKEAEKTAIEGGEGGEGAPAPDEEILGKEMKGPPGETNGGTQGGAPPGAGEEADGLLERPPQHEPAHQPERESVPA